MIPRILRFIRLPLLLIFIYTAGRFTLGLVGVPYAPRGNAVFSVLGVTLISSFYWGALSGRVGGFSWLGAALVGVALGLFSQILIFAATALSYALNLNTYFIHWDALNVPEGTVVPMKQALMVRAGGLLFGPIMGGVIALIGRALGVLAPGRQHSDY